MDANVEHKETQIEAIVRGDCEDELPRNKPKDEEETSCSSSTSSDSSSEEEFFQLDVSELNRAVTSSETLSAYHGGGAQLASEYGIRYGKAEDLIAGPQLPVGASTSPEVSGSSPQSDVSVLGTRQSPPVQSMLRSDVPDPNRIPAYVFERSKSTTPMEWSVASNESLFSIPMGNSSFSRDHVILLSRSGELGITPPISPLTSSSPPNVGIEQELPQSGAAETTNAGIEQELPQSGAAEATNAEAMEDVSGAAEATNAEAMEDVHRVAAEEHSDVKKPSAEGSVLSSSISHRSDGSASSFRSFAFPILTGEGRSGSVKVEPEPQHSEQPLKLSADTETPKVAPAAAKNERSTCFSCCSFCC